MRIRFSVILGCVVVVGAGCATISTAQRDDDIFVKALKQQRNGERQAALELYQSLNPVDNRYLSALNNMAIIHARDGDLQQAEQILIRALELEPDSVVSWANLGLIRAMLGDRTSALAALREVPGARRRLLERASGVGRSGSEYQNLARATELPLRVARRTASRLDRQRRVAATEGNTTLLLAL